MTAATMGDRIRTLREAMGMSGTELGNLVGVGRGSVSDWERDIYPPKTTRLPVVAAVLGTTVDYLMTGHNPPLIEASKRSTSDTLIAPDTSTTARPSGRLPVISWVQAGEWDEIVDNLREQGVQEWESCPFEGDFILPVIGDSNFNPGGERSYREGEHLSVSTKIEPRHRSMVIVKRKGDASAICRQLLIENDGVLMLQALNPSWPERYTKVDRETEIIGVVTGKWESQL